MGSTPAMFRNIGADDESNVLDGEYLGMPSQAMVPSPSLPWDMPPQQQGSQFDPSYASDDEYLADNPPFDFHNDEPALKALLPESPKLEFWQDKTHPDHATKLGRLARMEQFLPKILAGAVQGALAGSAGGNFGEGAFYARQAAQNLQQLQMQRAVMAQQAQLRQAQIANLQGRTAAIPQQQADLSAYRSARTKHLQTLTAESEARLKRAPADRFLHSYNSGEDGKVHFVFATPTGDQYERVSEQPFFQKEAPAPRPLLGHGPGGSLWLIHPETGERRMIVAPKADAPRKRGTQQQFLMLERWKNREWERIKNMTHAPDGTAITEEERLNALDDLQRHFESGVVTLGGDVVPYDVRSGTYLEPNGQQTNNNDPLGLR